ncbi:CAP domain-containing protein [Patescibacteria group bacterium]
MDIPGNKKFISTKTKVLSILLFVLFISIPTYASNITPEEILKLTNQSRIKYALPPLQSNEKLSKAADEKSLDMIANNYFSHTSPSNISPWYWFRKNDYTYQLAGENLAINYYDAESQHTAWMQSELHRKNILEQGYYETGISVREGNINGKNVLITVQLFASPKTIASNQVAALSNSQNSTLPPTSKKIASIQHEAPALKFGKLMQSKNLTFQAAPTVEHKTKQNNFVLGTSKRSLEKNIQQLLLFLFLATITIAIHLNVLSTINPKRLHHLSATNIVVIVIVFSVLLRL